MSLELKVKAKSLAAEAKIIRIEERKLKNQMKWQKLRQLSIDTNQSIWASLNHHRRWDVRNEQRATYLARAFLAGTPYIEVEQKRKDVYEYKFVQKIVPRIVSMVNKYGKGIQVDADTILKWAERK